MKNKITFTDNWGTIETRLDGELVEDTGSIKKVKILGKTYKTFKTDYSEYVSDMGHGAWVHTKVLTIKAKVFGRLMNFQLHTLPQTIRITKA